MPYWDWSINPTMPDVANQPMININAPGGTQSIVNPLYNYTFHPQPSATDFPPDEQVRSCPRAVSRNFFTTLPCVVWLELRFSWLYTYSDLLTARYLS